MLLTSVPIDKGSGAVVARSEATYLVTVRALVSPAWDQGPALLKITYFQQAKPFPKVLDPGLLQALTATFRPKLSRERPYTQSPD